MEREDDELRCNVALTWTEATDEDVRSYVNTIPTRDGGTHESGLREAVRSAVLKYMKDHEHLKKRASTSRARTSARGWSRCSRSASTSRSFRGKRRVG